MDSTTTVLSKRKQKPKGDKEALAEYIKDNAKEYAGIKVHGDHIRVNFYYKGKRCFESLKHIPLTKYNLKVVRRKRESILHQIAENKFDYASEFPNSKNAILFPSNSKKVPTVKEAINKYLNLKELTQAHSTYTGYQSASKHILKRWEAYYLDNITQSDLTMWMHTDLRRFKNKTINNVLVVFRGIFNSAIADESIKHNPFNYIKNLKIEEPEPDPYLRKELKVLQETVTDDIQLINAFIFNCWAGLRPSELIALSWEDIDMDNWTVRVKRANVKGHFKRTKTQNDRTVHLLDDAIEALKAQIPFSYDRPKTKIKITQADNKTVKTETGRIVFLNHKTGLAYDHIGDYGQSFIEHIKKTGIRYRPVGQARHTYASQLITAGINHSWIAKEMGYTSARMIEKHYGKWINEEKPDMAKQVSSILKKMR